MASSEQANIGQAVFDEPSKVSVEAGVVLIDGPDGVAFAMTPAAAQETAGRLRRAADEAGAAPAVDRG